MNTEGLTASLAGVAPELAERYRASGLWSETETVASIFASAVAQRGDAVAVVDSLGGSLTWADVEARSAGLAGALQRRGVGPGDVVAVQLPNRVEAMVGVAAVARLGAVINPMVPAFRHNELTYMTQLCATKALIVPGVYRGFDHDEMALRVSHDVPSIQAVVSLTADPPSGVQSFDALSREEPGQDHDVGSDAPTCVMFTSGTESRPKAVVHSSNTMLSNFRQTARLLDLDDDDNVFLASPFGHGSGYGVGVLMTTFLQSKLVFQAEWQPESAAELIAGHRCTYAHGSTPFVQELSEVEGVSPEKLGGFRWFVTGGVLIPPDLVRSARERLGCVVLRQYGQTEAFITSFNRPSDPDDVLAVSDGALLPEVDVQVRGDDGEALPAGDAGELWVRGPHRCLGLANDPERTFSVIDEAGYLASGDIGTVGADGRLSFKRRKKEVINRGGYKYSPAEIEAVLMDHGLIRRAVVVRMPDSRLGEKACAFLITRNDAKLDTSDLGGFLRERGVAKYKWPERVEVVDELPTTPSGKVQKYVLEQRLVAEASHGR